MQVKPPSPLDSAVFGLCNSQNMSRFTWCVSKNNIFTFESNKTLL